MPEPTSATIQPGWTPSSIEGWSGLSLIRKIEAIRERGTPEEKRRFLAQWSELAEPKQLPPSGDWTTWLMLGGRGAGKTRAGAEWVRGLVLSREISEGAAVERIALVGEIEACRVKAAPELRRIVVAVDPPASSGEGSDACGIVAAGSTSHRLCERLSRG